MRLPREIEDGVREAGHDPAEVEAYFFEAGPDGAQMTVRLSPFPQEVSITIVNVGPNEPL